MPGTDHSLTLGSPAGPSLVLTIDGYQFQTPRRADDANWINVRGQANDGLRSWKFVDACLETYDLTRLAAWFRQVEEGAAPAPCKFANPNLVFAFERGTPGTLRVHIKHACSPPWLKSVARLEGVTIAVPISLDDAGRAAAELDGLAVRFPVRGAK